MQRRTSGRSYTTSARATITDKRVDLFSIAGISTIGISIKVCFWAIFMSHGKSIRADGFKNCFRLVKILKHQQAQRSIEFE